MKLKKITKLVALLCIFSILLVGCGTDSTTSKEDTATNEEEVTTSEESERRVLHLGTEGTMPPWTYMEGDKLVGFEPDICEEIAKRLDCDVELQKVKWTGLFGMLDSERLDSIANIITITPEREEKYYFTKPYVYNPMVLATSIDSPINSLDDIDGKSIVVEPGSSDEVVVEMLESEYGIKLEKKFYEGISMKDVELGRVDLWIGGEPNLKVNIERGIKLKIVGKTKMVQEYGYPFLKNPEGEKLRDEFDKVLDEMKADGTLKAISEKHFGMDITEPIE